MPSFHCRFDDKSSAKHKSKLLLWSFILGEANEVRIFSTEGVILIRRSRREVTLRLLFLNAGVAEEIGELEAFQNPRFHESRCAQRDCHKQAPRSQVLPPKVREVKAVNGCAGY